MKYIPKGKSYKFEQGERRSIQDKGIPQGRKTLCSKTVLVYLKQEAFSNTIAYV